MSEWIAIEEQFPNKFPCVGINIKDRFKGIILGRDESNKIGNNWFHCEGLPRFMSMPITHWQPLSEKVKDES